MNTILKIVLSIVIIASVCIFFVTILDFNIGTIVFTFAIIISLFLGYKIINSSYNNNQKICLLILMSAVIRILWLLNTNNTPVSDFNVMYQSAKAFTLGDSSCFKGKAYIARFPHLTITVLYMSLMEYLFPQHNLLAMKIINLFLGLLVLVLIYFISYELFNDKRKALISLFIGSIFPPFVTYTSVFCSENLAMPLYLLSTYLFLKSMKSDKNKFLFIIFSSVVLALGNLFRMVADVILIAYILYIVIYFKDKILKKLLNIFCVIVPYIMIIVLVSNTLQNMNITENPLWRGSEPKITNVLKGTNMNSLGLYKSRIQKIFNLLGKHSTNMWLTHSFFCYYYFQGVTYYPKISILILTWLIILSLSSSYLIIYVSKLIKLGKYKFQSKCHDEIAKNSI